MTAPEPIPGHRLAGPDYDDRDDLCQCGKVKDERAKLCRTCEMRARRLRHRAHRLAEAVLAGHRLRIEPEWGMSKAEFGRIIRDVIRREYAT